LAAVVDIDTFFEFPPPAATPFKPSKKQMKFVDGCLGAVVAYIVAANKRSDAAELNFSQWLNQQGGSL